VEEIRRHGKQKVDELDRPGKDIGERAWRARIGNRDYHRDLYKVAMTQSLDKQEENNRLLERAERCRRLARETLDPDLAADLVQLAEKYERQASCSS
jgi:hypothetical protein